MMKYFLLQEINLYFNIMNMFWFLVCHVFSVVVSFYAGKKLRNEVVTMHRAISKLYSLVSTSKYAFHQVTRVTFTGSYIKQLSKSQVIYDYLDFLQSILSALQEKKHAIIIKTQYENWENYAEIARKLRKKCTLFYQGFSGTSGLCI